MDSKAILRHQTAGNPLHMDRGTYTMLQWSRPWEKSHEIRDPDGRTIPLQRMNRNFRVGDALPERCAVALNEAGDLLPQHEFAARYKEWLRGFGTTRNIEYEPIPSVKDFITKVLDPKRNLAEMHASYVDFGSWLGGADAPGEQKWGPDGETEAEWRAKQKVLGGVHVDATMEKARQLSDMKEAGDIDEATFSKRMTELLKVPEVPLTSPAIFPDAPLAIAAPCGKPVQNVGSHMYHCKDDRCVEELKRKKKG